MTLRSMMVTTIAALALVAGCKGGEQQQQAANPKPAQQPAQAPAAQPQAAAPAAEAKAVEVTPEAKAEADKMFASVCSTCHGATGAGDGPASAGFPVKPRAFQDQEWQKKVTDQHLRDVILKGGPAVGLSPLMPGNPQLEGKPEVLEALVQHVRELGKQ